MLSNRTSLCQLRQKPVLRGASGNGKDKANLFFSSPHFVCQQMLPGLGPHSRQVLQEKLLQTFGEISLKLLGEEMPLFVTFWEAKSCPSTLSLFQKGQGQRNCCVHTVGNCLEVLHHEKFSTSVPFCCCNIA